MRLVDTHCHLQSERFHDDREEVIARALDRLDWLVVIGDELPSSEAACALVRPRVYASVALHPYHANVCDDAAMARLRELAQRPGVCAIAEIGLDYFNEYSPRADQHRAFERQLDLACELKLPLAIHNREADADTLAMLRNFSGRLAGCIMHCFGSDAAFAEQCLAEGFYISFAGNVTYSKAENLREAARIVPMEHLLVETDAPYLSPMPLRGKRCEPQFVEHTATFLADLKGVDCETFGEITSANARCAYNLQS